MADPLVISFRADTNRQGGHLLVPSPALLACLRGSCDLRPLLSLNTPCSSRPPVLSDDPAFTLLFLSTYLTFINILSDVKASLRETHRHSERSMARGGGSANNTRLYPTRRSARMKQLEEIIEDAPLIRQSSKAEDAGPGKKVKTQRGMCQQSILTASIYGYDGRALK